MNHHSRQSAALLLTTNSQLENCLRWRIEVSPTVLTLTLNPRRAMIMTNAYAKRQGQRPLCSQVRAETDGWTDLMDGHDCTSHGKAIGNTP